MKVFVVFVESVEASREHASKVIDSIQRFANWQPELLLGVTPQTLHLYNAVLPIVDQSPSRIQGFRQNVYQTYLTKQSCFYNHVRVWQRCLELMEPVAFVEHDSLCVRDWDDVEFEQILILNAKSALRQSVVRKHLVKNGYSDKMELDHGMHEWTVPIYNRHTAAEDPPIMMPGTAAYAVSPQGAARLLHRLHYLGWEQSDHFINEHSAKIDYIMPGYFDTSLRNLKLSHGLNTK